MTPLIHTSMPREQTTFRLDPDLMDGLRTARERDGVPRRERSPGFPMVRADGDLVLTLEAALQNYEVIDATLEERAVLQRWGHPFGGVQ